MQRLKRSPHAEEEHGFAQQKDGTKHFGCWLGQSLSLHQEVKQPVDFLFKNFSLLERCTFKRICKKIGYEVLDSNEWRSTMKPAIYPWDGTFPCHRIRWLIQSIYLTKCNPQLAYHRHVRFFGGSRCLYPGAWWPTPAAGDTKERPIRRSCGRDCGSTKWLLVTWRGCLNTLLWYKANTPYYVLEILITNIQQE